MCLPCTSQVTPLCLIPDPCNLIHAPGSTFTDFLEAGIFVPSKLTVCQACRCPSWEVIKRPRGLQKGRHFVGREEQITKYSYPEHTRGGQ